MSILLNYLKNKISFGKGVVKVLHTNKTNNQNIIYKEGMLAQKVLYTFYGYWRRLIGLFSLRQYDVVYIFLWVTPFGSTFFEWLYTAIAKAVVYDIDDLVFHHKHKSVANNFIGFLKGRNKPKFLMSRANHVITCTPYLDEYARKFNPHTTDISSTINTVSYQPVNAYNNTHPLTLGWSGSHSTSKYMLLLQPVLAAVQKEYGIKVLVMGDESFTMEGVEVETVKWSEEAEISTLQRIDIGLYPLPLDDDWVMGKSGLKALQYMALGIPTVATAIGANYRVMEDGVSGFLVKTQAEWLSKLTLLINHPEERKRIGLAARTRVENIYSIKANQKTYLEILNSVTAH